MPKPKHNQPKSKPSPSPSPSPPSRPAPALDIANHLTALKADLSPDARAASAASPPAPVTDLSTAAAQLGEARALLASRTRELDDLARKLDDRDRVLDERDRAQLATHEKLERDRTALAESTRTHREHAATLSRDRQHLDDRTRQHEAASAALERQRLDLADREAAALAGYTTQLRAAIAGHEQHVVGLRDELTALQQRDADDRRERQRQRHVDLAALARELADRRDAHELDLQARRETLEHELQTRREQATAEHDATTREHRLTLAALRDEHDRAIRDDRDALAADRLAVATDRAELRRAQQTLALEHEDLTEQRRLLGERVTQLAAAAVERLTNNLNQACSERDEARTRRSELEGILRAREEADRRFGQRTPEEVLRALELAQAERDRLAAALASAPEADVQQRLDQRERERDGLLRELAALRGKLAAAEQRLASSELAVRGLEDLRDQKVSLESSRNLLRELNQQLRTDIDERLERKGNREVFPACLKMDVDPELQAAADLQSSDLELPKFLDDLRHRIAADGLFYSDRDLRCFLAGLAASRLHILQGISGTGKTSLPLAFAAAIDAGSTVIHVQAGWRDRHDLIGHYNAFDTVFHEAECLQALYRAGTPTHRERPFIVVLDEMNLSHPEHFFADFLSLLEQPRGPHLLELIAAEPRNSARPVGLIEGRRLPIPDNVWFIGTANHDETTKLFADKTFDRAHIMELPRVPVRFDPRKTYDRRPIALAAFTQQFTAAQRQHRGEADGAYKLLGELAEPLAKDFDITWGARLERQWAPFFSVVRAAGGTAGEAFDHVLATKILRRLRHRLDVHQSTLKPLRDRVKTCFDRLKWPERESHALTLLDDLHGNNR